jgi:hypothetical protein
METPKILRILNKAAIVGLVVTALSFVLPLVPCKAESGFSLCSLPNPLASIPEVIPQYYGYSNNPLTGAVLQFLIPSIIFMAIFMFFRKKTAKVLDLSKK